MNGDATALGRHTGFFNQPWPELLAAGAVDRDAWVEKRRSSLEASRAMLTAVLEGRVPPGVECLLSPDGYARLVGMIDLVTKDIGHPHPLDAPLRALLDGLPVKAVSDLRKVGLLWLRAKISAQDCEEPTSPDDSSDEEGEEEIEAAGPGAGVGGGKGIVNLCEVSRRVRDLPILPGFDGFALSPSVAFTNHSCVPNVDVVRLDSGELEVVALRAIGTGEEILMSYIEEEDPTASRRRDLLKSYGFLCRCPRCEDGAQSRQPASVHEEGRPPEEPQPLPSAPHVGDVT
eukprot:NODE_12676_length_1210_cov_2.941828.p1 GENE.NODE_12676_length_1210_cov_2.941828~~NODE_12676_length_1210_cov_2.941828.p1  ORF type:complete len:288 (-),score=81.77 NODE_12676_length_1210_cov_2.941828:278-1141(-)